MKKSIKSIISLMMCLIMLMGVVPAAKVEADYGIATAEVTAHYVDESGNPIDLGSNSYTEVFYFHHSDSNGNPTDKANPYYTTTVAVSGSSGMGIAYIYIYSVEYDTYYLTNPSVANQTIQDSDGNALVYQRTEYSVGENPYEESDDNKSEVVNIDANETYVFNVYFVYAEEQSERDIDVSVVWDDGNNQDGRRPFSAAVRLVANGVDTDEVLILDAENGWTDTFEDCSTKDDNGNEIQYTINGGTVLDGYTTAVTGNANDGFVVTYKHTPETTSVSGGITWYDDNDRDGKRPNGVNVELLKNGVSWNKIQSITEDDMWKYNFNALPKYQNGREIIYTIKLTEVTDYTGTVDGHNIKYSYSPAKISLGVTVVWDDENDVDGIRPEHVSITQTNNTVIYSNGVQAETKTVDKENEWKCTFNDLFEYFDKEEIKYTITANDVEGYQRVISGDKDSGFTITYSHTAEKMNLPVEIQWNDNNDENKARPNEVEVTLLKDGTATTNKLTLKDTENWSGLFNKLDKQTEDGNSINYSITGATVKNYEFTSEYDKENGKYILTYTYKKEEVPPTENTPTNNNGNGTSNSLFPNTGDSNSAGLWLGLMGISVLALIGVLIKKYSSKKH